MRNRDDFGIIQTQQYYFPLMKGKTSLKSKSRTQSKRLPKSKLATPSKTVCRFPCKISDIETIFQQMHKISSSILKEQRASLLLQKQTLEDFLKELDHFWSILLSDLSQKNEEDYQASFPVALALLKRQTTVANEIVNFRTESHKQMACLVQQQIELLRLHSLKSTSMQYQ